MQTYTEFSDSYKQFIKYAPPAKPGPDGLIGFWCPVDGGDAFICQPCASRLLGRGFNLPQSVPVWAGDITGICCVCSN